MLNHQLQALKQHKTKELVEKMTNQTQVNSSKNKIHPLRKEDAARARISKKQRCTKIQTLDVLLLTEDENKSYL